MAQDRLYHITTESDGVLSPKYSHDAVHYEPTPYGLIKRVIRILRPKPQDVVFDIGCGKGRVLALFARCGVRRVVGVEIDPVLADVASRNALRLRGRNVSVEVVRQNAAETRYDDG